VLFGTGADDPPLTAANGAKADASAGPVLRVRFFENDHCALSARCSVISPRALDARPVVHIIQLKG
jgi:hypothetical protein